MGRHFLRPPVMEDQTFVAKELRYGVFSMQQAEQRQRMRTRAALTRAAAAQIPACDDIPLGTAITPTVITLTGGEYLA